MLHFDGVEIGAADLAAGVAQYRELLGVEPLELHSGRWRFPLDRGAVELAPGPDGLRALRFLHDAEHPGAVDFNGLEVRIAPAAGARESAHVRDVNAPAGSVHAIDHVVIASADLRRAIALWRDRLGVRLALEREFPARGLRMLFFRSAGMTLEFASAIGAADPAGADRLDGVAYQVRDLPACRERLVDAGLDLSGVRDGFKRGTRVMSVRSATLGVPTLLIEHLEGAPS